MKNLIIAALLSVSLATTAFAAPAKEMGASSSFQSDFKGATNVTWKTTSNFVKASFLLNNVRMEAFYDFEGNMIAKSSAISIDQLPQNAKATLDSKYVNYKVVESVSIDGPEETAFYVSVKNENETLILKVDQFGAISQLQTLK